MSRNDVLYKLIKLGVMLMGRLPRPILTFLADSLGLIWYLADGYRRRIVMENIQVAFPGKYSEKGAKRFVRKNFMHTIGIPFEMMWSYAKTPEELFSYFTFKGQHHLDAAYAKGRGVMGLICHMGTFEFLVIGVAMAGIDPYVLYRTLDFPPLERLTREMRERFGTTMIPVRNASRRIAGHMREGHLVATLLDQNVDWYQGVFVEFFGRPACIHKSLAKLVMETGSPVIPAFIMRDKGRYIVEAFPELEIQRTGDSIKDIENNTQQFISAIEMMVRKCPEQYFWVHNLWKTRNYCLIEERPA